MSDMNLTGNFFSEMERMGYNPANLQFDADANGDGYVSKKEFLQFVKDIRLNTTENEAKQLYKLFNTNKNGKTEGGMKNSKVLTSDEIEAMENQYAAYQEISNIIKQAFSSGYGSVIIPADLKAYVSEASVKTSIFSSLGKNFEIPEDIEGKLNVAIARSGSDGLAHKVYQNKLSIFKNELPAGFNTVDSEFETKLSTFIRSLNADTDLNTVVVSINVLVNDYFKTAGLGGVSEDNATTLTRLQLARISKLLTQSLGEDGEKFMSKFPDKFNDALNNYISEKFEGQTFPEIQRQINARDFLDSKYGMALSALVMYSDFSIPEMSDEEIETAIKSQNFNSMIDNMLNQTPPDYNKAYFLTLAKTLGIDFAKNLSEADIYYKDGESYNQIVNAVYQMVLDGELTSSNDIIRKIIELVATNYSQFASELGLNVGNGSPVSLYNTFANMIEADSDIEAIKTVAKNYVNAILALNNETLNTTVANEFGSDPIGTIDSLKVRSAIETKINNIKKVYQELVDTGYVDDGTETTFDESGWGNLPDQINFQYIATSNEYKLLPTFNKTIARERVSYDFLGTTELVQSFDPNSGKLFITSSNLAEGDYTLTIQIKVDGKIISQKNVSVHCERKHNMDMLREKLGASGTTNCGWYEDSTSTIRSGIKTTAESIINSYMQKLAALNIYDSENIVKACNTVYNFYSKLADNMETPGVSSSIWGNGNYNITKRRSSTISFYNEFTGQYESTQTNYDVRRRTNKTPDSDDASTDSGNTSGITFLCRKGSKTHYYAWIDNSIILDKIMQYL